MRRRMIVGLVPERADAVRSVAEQVGAQLGLEPEFVFVARRDDPVPAGPRFDGIRVVRGEPAEALVALLDRPDVALGVLGLREGTSRVSLDVLSETRTPVLVVPPEVTSIRLRTILAPLDGSERASRAVRAASTLLAPAAPAIVPLHVFERRTAPRFLDRAEEDVEAWAEEFMAGQTGARYGRLRLRGGPPERAIVAQAAAAGVDALILGWKQELGSDRAMVIREALAHARCPVLVMPSAPASAPR